MGCGRAFEHENLWSEISADRVPSHLSPLVSVLVTRSHSYFAGLLFLYIAGEVSRRPVVGRAPGFGVRKRSEPASENESQPSKQPAEKMKLPSERKGRALLPPPPLLQWCRRPIETGGDRGALEMF